MESVDTFEKYPGGSPARSGAGDHSAPGQFEVVLGSAGLKHKVPFRSGEHGDQ